MADITNSYHTIGSAYTINDEVLANIEYRLKHRRHTGSVLESRMKDIVISVNEETINSCKALGSIKGER